MEILKEDQHTQVPKHQNLPVEIVSLILETVDVPTLLASSQVSKTWFSASLIPMKKRPLAQNCSICSNQVEKQPAKADKESSSRTLNLVIAQKGHPTVITNENNVPVSSIHCKNSIHHQFLTNLKSTCQHCYQESGNKHPIHGYRVGRRCWSRHRKYALISHEEALQYAKVNRFVDGHMVNYLSSHPYFPSGPGYHSGYNHISSFTSCSFRGFGTHSFMYHTLDRLNEMDLNKIRFCEVVIMKSERVPTFYEQHLEQQRRFHHLIVSPTSPPSICSPETSLIRYYLLEDVEEIARISRRQQRNLIIY